MTPELMPAPQLGLLDRAAIELDTQYDYYRVKPAVVVASIIGAAAGFGASRLVDAQFTLNHQYQAGVHHISDLEATKGQIEHASNTLRANGVQVPSMALAAKEQALTTEIAEAKTALPHGYQPHLEGLADVGGLATAAALVGAGVMTAIKHRASKARERKLVHLQNA